jgi:ubiquitin carboxyl-terminal hydrolase 10
MLPVVNHHGMFATGGHYTLDVLHPTKTPEAWGKGWREGWIRMDDEHIIDLPPHEVTSPKDAEDRTAYLLFYRRIGGD